MLTIKAMNKCLLAGTKMMGAFLFASHFIQCQSNETKVEYFENGSIKSSVSVLDGRKEGDAVVYSPNGNIMATHHYKNDSLTGTSFYYNGDGRLSKVVNYKNGIKQGHYEIFYSNGNIAEVGNYNLGLKHGKILKYFEDDSGKVHNEFYVVNMNNSEFPYYNKRFKKNGDLESDIRSLVVEIESDSVKATDNLKINFELSASLQFDSAAIVVGQFDNSLNPIGESDTVLLGINHKTRLEIPLIRKGPQLLRGKWSVIRVEQDADSTYQYNTFGYFEEHIVVF